MKHIIPATILLMFITIQVKESYSRKIPCSEPLLLKKGNSILLNCNSGDTIYGKNRTTLNLKIRINKSSLKELQDLFGKSTGLKLFNLKNKRGYLCKFSPNEIFSLVSFKNFMLCEKFITCN
jgi:hypothetical protein